MKKSLFIIVLGLIIVGSSGYGFMKYMISYRVDVTTMTTIKPKQMIHANELITPDMLRRVTIPTVQHMDNTLTDMDQIVGKRAIVPIGASEEIALWKIDEEYLVPKEGEEYLAFEANIVTTANNMIRRGDRVSAWVEYESPKIVDRMGNEIKVDPNSPQSANINGRKIYAEKLVDNLTVASIKTTDGALVTDVKDTNLPLMTDEKRDQRNSDTYRSNPNGQPAYVTFIMNDEQYQKVVEGTKRGKLKLGLSTGGMIGTITNSAAANQGAVTGLDKNDTHEEAAK
ncbi:SAF domain-containing protein [Paenibacillus gansuensis]|uniref:SAF domain-containing protein n=1 Tax=Paenibacillus gansuensis TaxID=306542 RepID=A0ABW5PGY3_9BACL